MIIKDIENESIKIELTEVDGKIYQDGKYLFDGHIVNDILIINYNEEKPFLKINNNCKI